MQTEEILVCDCNSTEHQIVIYPDKEEGLVYCHIHLTKYSFFKRLWKGLKYICGYSCKYGEWDEFIFKKEHSEKLMKISNFLKNNP